MSKIKEWLKPTQNKIIAGVVAALIVVSCSFGIYAVINASSEPTITFKENIVFEYGEKIDKDNLWNKVVDTTVTTETYSIVRSDVNTSVVNKENHTEVATLVIENAEVEFRYNFKYSVKDTQKPVLENVKDVTLYIGDAFEPTKLFTASDPVDGKLPIKIDGGYDVKTAGTYDLNVSATDKHGNVTTKPFKLIVKEVESNAPESPADDSTTNTSYGSDNDTTWTDNGSSNSNGDGNDTSYVPPVTETPVQPSVPEFPTNEAPEGMFLYHKYPSFEACNAVIEDVLFSDIGEYWTSNFCASDGSMYYLPN